MALKPPGPLAPGVSHAEPVSKMLRPRTGAPLSTVELDFGIGLEVSVAEADLYLHWASDLLAPATEDDDDGSS
jgi:hypothetical protein